MNQLFDTLIPYEIGRRWSINEHEDNAFNVEIAEIERLVRDFKERFTTGTASADKFMTISQLELIWSELQNRTNNIYSDMIRKLMSEVDEKDLIRKKKGYTNSKG